MLRKAIQYVLLFSTWLKKRQRVTPNGRPLMVNLGSGLTVAPGWINIDGSVHAKCSTWPVRFQRWLHEHSSDVRKTHSVEEYLQILNENRFVHHELYYGVPFDDEKVDVIYSSHVIEHLFREEAEGLLRDAYRTLKRGGLIRIAVPDLEHAVKVYQSGAKEEALTFFFSLQRAGYLSQHHYMYDFELLRSLLASVGFADIRRCSFQRGECPDMKILDNRPEETLFVEARK